MQYMARDCEIGKEADHRKNPTRVNWTADRSCTRHLILSHAWFIRHLVLINVVEIHQNESPSEKQGECVLSFLVLFTGQNDERAWKMKSQDCSPLILLLCMCNTDCTWRNYNEFEYHSCRICSCIGRHFNEKRTSILKEHQFYHLQNQYN